MTAIPAGASCARALHPSNASESGQTVVDASGFDVTGPNFTTELSATVYHLDGCDSAGIADQI